MLYLFHFIPDYTSTHLPTAVSIHLFTLFIIPDTTMSDNEKGESSIEVDDVDEDVKDIKPKSENADTAIPRKRVSRLLR
jgi:hypothetical protein